MIEATRRWFRRNRANLLVGAGVIGAGYLAGQYVLGRIREARQRMNEDRISKENLRRRFEQNQEDCTYTVLALLPTIRDEIIGALPVEQITEQLQQERQERLKRLAASEAPSSEYPSAPPSIVDDASTASFVHASQMMDDRPKRSKAQLWQEMKINSIARALSLLYTLALLSLLTRIQLNLLGRRTYLSSVVSMAAPADINSSTISLEDRDDPYGNDFETNRMYLTFSWWILHRGAKRLLDRVMAAVKDVFGQVNIREDMTLERLSELIIEVRRRVEGATEQERRHQSWLEYLLPPRSEELFVINQAGSDSDASPEPKANPLDIQSISPSLRRLLDETADLIDSPTFALVLSHLLDTGFSHLVDVKIAAEAFRGDARVTDIDARCKLAHILPIFCRQAHAIVVGAELEVIPGQPVANDYLALMDRVHDLEAFAAVIYSSNFEYEAVDSPRETAAAPSVISLPDTQALGESLVTLNSEAASSTFESAWNKIVPVISEAANAPITDAVDTSITDASIIDLSTVQNSIISTATSTASTISNAAAPAIVSIQQTATGAAASVSSSAQAIAARVQDTVVKTAPVVRENVSQVSSTVAYTSTDAANSAKEVIFKTAADAQELTTQVKSVVQQKIAELPETPSIVEQPGASAVVNLPMDESLSQPAIQAPHETIVPTMEAASELAEPTATVETQSAASTITPRQAEIEKATPAPVAPKEKS